MPRSWQHRPALSIFGASRLGAVMAMDAPGDGRRAAVNQLEEPSLDDHQRNPCRDASSNEYPADQVQMLGRQSPLGTNTSTTAQLINAGRDLLAPLVGWMAHVLRAAVSGGHGGGIANEVSVHKTLVKTLMVTEDP